MTARAAQPFADAAASGLSRRDRRAVTMRASATRGDGTIVDMMLLDLSHDGCGVDSPVPLVPGETVKLAVDGRGLSIATVRWAAGGKAGLEFAAEPGPGERFNPAAPVERRHERIGVDAEVTLRRSGKLNYRVRLHDLTQHGCKAEFVERPEMDELVWIKFDGMEALEARVCWAAGATAGMIFSHPFHPAVFGLLLSRLKLSHARP